MVWHIFKKDVRLLWGLAAGVSLAHFVVVAGLFKLGHFGNSQIFGPPAMLQILHLIAFLCTGVLIIAVVHQDVIPGFRQDWLVRPIRRGDLLLAKFLFVLLIALGPIFLADLLEALADGFPLGQSLSASISRSAYFIFSFAIPSLLFAAVTKNLNQAVLGGLMTLAGYAGYLALLQAGHPAVAFVIGVGNSGGIGWITDCFRLCLWLLGGAAVLRVQYWSRKTKWARWVVAGIVVACLLTLQFPWQYAFAMQQAVSRHPGASSNISVALDPGMGRVAAAPGMVRGFRERGLMLLSLPLHFSGIPSDVVLKTDRAETLVSSFDGGVMDRGDATELEIRKEGQTDGDVRVWQDLYLPMSTYNRIKDQTVRLGVNYSMTLLGLATAHAIPAVDGNQRMAGVGWCATRVNGETMAVDLSCLQAGPSPLCGTVFLEHVPSGQRNPEISSCRGNYMPSFGGSLFNTAVTRFGVSTPFSAPTGLAAYPVDGGKLADSRVILRIYQPVDHFKRRLVMPEIRLRDWVRQ